MASSSMRDSTNSKVERKACFEQTIQEAVVHKISRPIVVTKAISDTILIDFEISNVPTNQIIST